MKTKIIIFLALIVFQNISGQIIYGEIGTKRLQTICNGTTPLQLIISGRVTKAASNNSLYSTRATLIQWQRSTDGGSTWSNIIGQQSTIYKPNVLTETTHYKAYVESSFGNGFSDVAIITVSPEQNGGTISEGQTICIGTSATTISCSVATGGHEEYTYLWEQSTNGGNTWSNASGANNGQNYFPGILTQTTHFRRMATNACGTVYSNVAIITVGSEQNAGTISEGQTICNGVSEATIICSVATGGIGTYTYLWEQSTNGGSTWSNASGTNNSNNYNSGILTQTTHFRRMATNGCGTVNSDVAVVSVSSEQNGGTINEGQTICIGTSATTISCSAATGGIGTYTYLWEQSTNGGNTWSNASGENNGQNYFPGILTQTTHFRRIATNSCGTVSSGIAVVSVSSEQNAGTISEGQTICYRTSPAIINCSAATGGLGVYNYSWEQSINGGNTWSNTTGINNQQNYNPRTLTQTTHFRRMATNSCGTVFSYAIEIEVHEELVAPTIEADQVICYNTNPSPIKIKEYPTGGSGSYSYQWQQSYNGVTWNNITGAIKTYYEPKELTKNTYYRLVVEEKCRTKESNAVLINVSDEFSPGKIGEDQLILYNTTPKRINVSISPTGGSDINSYQWQKSTNGSSWINITGAILESYEPLPLTQTTYFKRLTTNALCGMKETNAVKINVVTEIIAGKIGESQTICMNAQANTITTIEPSSEGIGVYYVKWQKSTNGIEWSEIIGATGESLNPGTLTQTTYFKKIITTDIAGDIETNTVTITVLPKLAEVEIGDNQESCINSIPNPLLIKTDVSGNTGDYSYQWQISLNNAKWDDITNATNSYYEPKAISSLTYFRLKISSICGSAHSNSVQIVVNEELISGNIEKSQNVGYNGTPTILTGETASGGTGDYSYQWQRSIDNINWSNVINKGGEKDYQPTALTQTTYFKRIVSSGNCGNIQSNVIKITVQEAIKPGNIGSNQTICYNGTAEAITGAEASGGIGSFSYKWEKSTDGTNWKEIIQETGISYVPREVLVNTYYRRGATSGGVTEYTNNVLIRVTEVVIKPIFNAKQYYCKGESAQINIVNAIYNLYNWYDLSGNLLRNGTSYSTQSVLEDKTFIIEAVNNSGCRSEKTVLNIKVDQVKANFSQDLNSVETGSPVRYTNTSTNAVNYKWNFFDGDVITENSPWHYYYNWERGGSKKFDVELTAISANQCYDIKLVKDAVTVLSIMGIEEKEKSKISIEENPVISLLKIISNQMIEQVTITNMSGNRWNYLQQAEINMTDYRSGIYIVTVVTVDKEVKQFKIAKK